MRITILLISIPILLVFGCKEQTDPILPTELNFSTIEDFEFYCDHFSDISVFDGNIVIDLREIEDLNVDYLNCLNNIERISGGLSIFSYNGKNYEFLQNLKEVGFLEIIDNNCIDSLIFNNLSKVNGQISIKKNDNLIYFSTPILSELNLDVMIIDNQNLLEWNGSETLTSLYNIIIESNPKFSTLSNFTNVNLIAENLFVVYDSVRNHNFLEDTFTVGGGLEIISNKEKPDLNFLKRLVSATSVEIYGRITIEDLCPLKNYSLGLPNNILCYSWITEETYLDIDIINNCP